MPLGAIQRVDVNVEPVHHAAGLQRTWSASKIDGHRILLPVHESSSWLIWVNVGGGQGHDVRIRNELRRGPMGIVIRDREVTGIRERSYNDELVAGVDLVERLVIYAVQIAPFGASPVASGERDQVAGIVEIAEKVPCRELVPGELSRQARTIDGMCRAAGFPQDLHFRNPSSNNYTPNCLRDWGASGRKNAPLSSRGTIGSFRKRFTQSTHTAKLPAASGAGRKKPVEPVSR